MSEERIQRILARAGVVSRRGAKELLREGRVTVNGQVAEIGGKADPEKDAIKVDGRRVQPHVGPHHYLLLNKPKGVLSTVSDPEGRTTVIDLVPPVFRKALVPVGRLDYNTEGLILLTDDGELAQHVAHPRYGGVKTYEVKVKGRPSEEELDRLRGGISLEGRRTAPARITPRHAGQGERHRGRRRPPEKAQKAKKTQNAERDEGENTWWTVELTEGRTRQIREMFFRIGHPVQKLRRVAIGPLRDPDLPVGAVRELSEREVELLRRVTARPKPQAQPKPESKAPSRPKPKVKPKPKAKTAAVPRATPGRRGPGEEARPRRRGEAPPARSRGASRPAEGLRRPARPGRPGTSAPGRPGRAAPGRPERGASGRPGRAASGRPGRAASGRPGKPAPGRKPAGGPRRGGAGGARRPPRGRGGGS